jgi:hypothetical protein
MRSKRSTIFSSRNSSFDIASTSQHKADAGLLDDEIIAIDHALTRPRSTLESLDSHRVRGTAFGGAPPRFCSHEPRANSVGGTVGLDASRSMCSDQGEVTHVVK